MRRRDFIKVVAGSATTWPLAARAQQSATPTVGFVNTASADGFQPMTAAFRRGLQKMGYVEGQNLAIEFAGQTIKLIGSRSL
jgi:putative ABC transport system substrate-binding protein